MNEAPGRLRTAFRSLDSSVAALFLASVVTLAVGMRLVPLTGASLFESASQFVSSSDGNAKALLYRNVSGRPFERCSSEDAQRQEMLGRVRSTVEAVANENPLSSLTKTLAAYGAEASRFYGAPCQGAWTRSFDLFDYADAFPRAVPYLGVITRLHLSEVHVSLWLMVGAWAGLFCLFHIGRSVLRSNIGGLIAVGGLWLVFRWVPLAGNELIDVLNVFPLVWAAQVAARPQADGEASITPTDIVAAFVFVIWAILTLFTFPSTSKTYPLLMVLTVGAYAIVSRSPRAALRTAVLVMLLFAVRVTYQSYAANLLEVVSTVNTASSAEFLPVTMLGSTSERPSYHGFPIGDTSYAWALLRDPLLEERDVPNLFHSFRPWSNTYWQDMLLHRPWALPLHWWRRVVEVVGFHDVLAVRLDGTGQGESADTGLFWLSLALVCLAAAPRRDRWAMWPVTAICLVEPFGINVLQGIVHTQALDFQRGSLLPWTFLLLSAALVLKRLPRAFAGLRRLPGLGRAVRRAPWRATIGVVLSIGLAWVLVDEARQETRVFRIWKAIDFGLFRPEFYIRHDDVVKEIDALDRLAPLEPGAVSMYAAQVMYFRHHGIVSHQASLEAMDVDVAAESASARESMIRYYHEALKRAPDNPHYPSYAKLLESPDWPELFRGALRQFPDHPYAAMMAFSLARSGGLPLETTHEYGRRFAWEQGRLYAQTASHRPGFRRIPTVFREAGQDVSGRYQADGMSVQLQPGERVVLDAVETHGSDRIAVLLYADATAGSATLCMATRDACTGTEIRLAPEGWNPYRMMDTNALEAGARRLRPVIEAGADGATVTLRDLYPLIENPRLH